MYLFIDRDFRFPGHWKFEPFKKWSLFMICRCGNNREKGRPKYNIAILGLYFNIF